MSAILAAIGGPVPECAWCGTTEPPFNVDHILPRARGGLDDLSNYQVLCRRCNVRKHAWFPPCPRCWADALQAVPDEPWVCRCGECGTTWPTRRVWGEGKHLYEWIRAERRRRGAERREVDAHAQRVEAEAQCETALQVAVANVRLYDLNDLGRVELSSSRCSRWRQRSTDRASEAVG